MPGFNRTGPEGSGPMTGRQLGPCGSNKRNNQRSGFRTPGAGLHKKFGRGAGPGHGRGLGFRWGKPFAGNSGYFEDAAAGEANLENEVRSLKDQLSRAEKELEQLRNEKSE